MGSTQFESSFKALVRVLLLAIFRFHCCSFLSEQEILPENFQVTYTSCETKLMNWMLHLTAVTCGMAQILFVKRKTLCNAL